MSSCYPIWFCALLRASARFGCTCYPNTAATAPPKLSPCSTRCVFLGYSTDHKGYRCLNLSTNRLIVSRYVVFDEDSFPLTASPSLTNLDFLCESGSTVSTIGTRLTTAGTSTPAPRWIAPEIPPGFEPPVAPLAALTVPLGFLPRAAGPHSCATRGPDCATCRHRRSATPYMAGLTGSLRPAPSVARASEYHSTTPSSAPFCEQSGRGGACHAPRKSTSDDHTGQDWF
jgi:hypothetical protein